MNLYSTLYISPLSLERSDVARVLLGDYTVSCATHTRTISTFTPQPQGITAFLAGPHCAYPRRDGQTELT